MNKTIRADQPTTIDTLGTNAYSEALARFVLNCQTPMTVGVQGEWGSGKSSIMKMVESRIENPQQMPADMKISKTSFKDYTSEDIFAEERETYRKRNSIEKIYPKDLPAEAFYFETWQFGVVEPKNLGLRFIEVLCKKIDEQLTKRWQQLKENEDLLGIVQSKASQLCQHTMNMCKSMLIPTAGAVLKKTAGIDSTATKAVLQKALLPSDPDNFEHKDELILHQKKLFRSFIEESLLELEKSRLIIFIDDLDRIHPTSALTMLEVLKNFMDIKGCVFVLACDYEVIKEGVKNKFGINDEQKAHAFFDKIIQVPFDVPVEKYKIDRMLIDYLSEKKAKVPQGKFNKWKEFSYNIIPMVSLSVGKNPRAFKRFLNVLDLLASVAEANELLKSGKTINVWKSNKRWVPLLSLVALQTRWPTISTWMTAEPTRDYLAPRLTSFTNLTENDAGYDEVYHNELFNQLSLLVKHESGEIITPSNEDGILGKQTVRQLIMFMKKMILLFDTQESDLIINEKEALPIEEMAQLISVTSLTKDAQPTSYDTFFSYLEELDNKGVENNPGRSIVILLKRITDDLGKMRKGYKSNSKVQPTATALYYKCVQSSNGKESLFLKLSASGSITIYLPEGYNTIVELESKFSSNIRTSYGKRFVEYTFAYLSSKKEEHEAVLKFVLTHSASMWKEASKN